MDDAQRAKMISEFDGYSDARKFELGQICWEAFYNLQEIMEELEIKKMLVEVEAGQRELKTIKVDAKKRVMKELQDILSGAKADNQQIEDIRGKLKMLMGEKQLPA